MKNLFWKSLSFLLLGFSFTGCVKEPVTGTTEFIVTSEADENELGERAYQEVLHKERRSHNAYYDEIVQRVGGRIAAAANKPEYHWEFTVLDSEEQNAFCLPGGKVAVYTGILPAMGNEAALAAVLGHEVGHATARHAGARMTEQNLVQLGLSVLDGIIGGQDSTEKKLLMGALGIGAVFGAHLPFSRRQEAAADHIGLVYMAQAGYDPQEATRFWERFTSQKKGGAMPVFFSDHPSDSSRIEALKTELPEAIPYYQGAKVQYGSGQKIIAN